MSSDSEDYATKEQLQQDIGIALSPLKLGVAFKDATEKSKDIDSAIQPILINLIENNKIVKDALDEHIQQYDRKTFKILIGKFGTLIVSLISVTLGSILTALLTKIL